MNGRFRSPCHRLRSALVLRAATLSLLAQVGCADAADASDEPLASVQEGPDAGTPSIDAAVLIPEAGAPSRTPLGADAALPFVVDVRAQGTGCPPGTWTTVVSRDEGHVTTSFSAYEVLVHANTLSAVKECGLIVMLQAPEGLSYAITDLRLAGYAFLTRGAQATVTATHFFAGTPMADTPQRTTLVGPYDDSFISVDTVAESDMVWSPCITNFYLNVQTRVVLRSGTPPAESFLIMAAPRGGQGLSLRFRWRGCSSGSSSSMP